MAGNFLLLCRVFFVALSTAFGSPIGVCYGMLGNDLPPPREELLEALRNSDIEVLVGVGNEELQQLASTESAAEDWVETYNRPYSPQVNFRYIAVGNEVVPEEEAGAPQVQVAVSERGWPSDGNGNLTTPSIAQKYNSNLMRHVLSSHGTPRRAEKSIEAYLFAMFNENMKPGEAVERQLMGSVLSEQETCL
ncbi:hypothetical protein C1H46_015884 [Malus baccata]|uniref:glucan endo-1,3-beta-D-glucosidase n=1 Tax=Malus baccata TaxID=106549 RepID=A0A540MIL9_MALBA|nr:hypothetical protein C1H46_015884 [Malus baccata]